MNPLLAAALRYASLGWYVFPISPGSKVPRQGSSGFKDATLNPAQIEAWWQANPCYNVAISTGASGLAVMDVDTGLRTFQDLQDFITKYRIPRTHIVRSGKRKALGVHIYFSPSMPGCNFDLGGVTGQIKSVGGYVLAPPSIHPITNDKYELLIKDPPAPLPDWVRALADETKRVKPLRHEEIIPEGYRHAFLKQRAQYLVWDGITDDLLDHALLGLRDRHCKNGARIITDKEITGEKGIARWAESHPLRFDLKQVDRIALRQATINDLRALSAWNGELLTFEGNAEKAYAYICEALRKQQCSPEQVARILNLSPLRDVMEKALGGGSNEHQQ